MKKVSVLLISGWAHGAEAMRPLADALAGSYPVTSFSLADLGISRGEGEAASIAPYARAIALHHHKSGEHICIVGWSTGAVAALQAAADYPEKVAGLVLLSATARFCSGKEYTAGADPAALRAMIRGLKRSPEAVVAQFLSQALYPVRVPANELAWRTKNGLQEGTDSLIDALEYLARVDLRDALPEIATPCLIIHGMRDRIVPWQAARFLASNLPVSNVEFLPSAGHSLIEQCGKDLIDPIGQFVESLR